MSAKPMSKPDAVQGDVFHSFSFELQVESASQCAPACLGEKVVEAEEYYHRELRRFAEVKEEKLRAQVIQKRYPVLISALDMKVKEALVVLELVATKEEFEDVVCSLGLMGVVQRMKEKTRPIRCSRGDGDAIYFAEDDALKTVNGGTSRRIFGQT
ncbi:hypothetical protein MIND_00690400 [Mycena indigotica]|uniref:Uncharacterized protein n=1 Tax=Mycena indigotica TaxID=2126181 RepID=A0A8H6SMA7_9AGAR|nr:uncharacterized protein MIND_00690400 [Mycena indigotica]KAF7301256.1 hypothetical protein MIND_00690400 [Mycena indigotica]